MEVEVKDDKVGKRVRRSKMRSRRLGWKLLISAVGLDGGSSGALYSPGHGQDKYIQALMSFIRGH